MFLIWHPVSLLLVLHLTAAREDCLNKSFWAQIASSLNLQTLFNFELKLFNEWHCHMNHPSVLFQAAFWKFSAYVQIRFFENGDSWETSWKANYQRPLPSYSKQVKANFSTINFFFLFKTYIIERFQQRNRFLIFSFSSSPVTIFFFLYRSDSWETSWNANHQRPFPLHSKQGKANISTNNFVFLSKNSIQNNEIVAFFLWFFPRHPCIITPV